MTAPVLTSDDRHPDVIDQPAAVVDAEPTPAPTSSADVRAQVEAAIAARKAALQAKPCTGCGTKVEPGDAFCRSCGTKVTA
jgi:hypothetical protein